LEDLEHIGVEAAFERQVHTYHPNSKKNSPYKQLKKFSCMIKILMFTKHYTLFAKLAALWHPLQFPSRIGKFV
jgi:hypothetical protein